MNCIVCNQELGVTEYQIHENCKLCEYCRKPVHNDIIVKLMADGETVHHAPCHDKKLLEDYSNKPVTLTQAHLDALNKAMFAFQPNMELSKETNQDITVLNVQPLLNEISERENGLDQLYYVMSNLEALAACCHLVIGKNKQYVIARDEERSKRKFKEKDEYLAASELRVKEQREANKAKFERLDPQAKARRNAIDGFIKLGIPEEQAIKMVDSQNSGKAN